MTGISQISIKLASHFLKINRHPPQDSQTSNCQLPGQLRMDKVVNNNSFADKFSYKLFTRLSKAGRQKTDILQPGSP